MKRNPPHLPPPINVVDVDVESKGIVTERENAPDDPTVPTALVSASPSGTRLGLASGKRRGPVRVERDPLKMLGVVVVMGLAMIAATATLALLPVRPSIRTGHMSVEHPLMFFGDGELRVRTALFGLVFVAWGSIALVLTRAWHGVRPQRRIALQAATYVGLGHTLILVAAAAVSGINFRPGSWLALVVYVGLSAAASILGAHLVVRATLLVTGRREHLLSRAMLLWGAGWVGIQQVIERSKILASTADGATTDAVASGAKVAHAVAFAPQVVLAWQLPLGLAVAIWFARTHSRPATELQSRADIARCWGKAAVLVAIALLLLGVAVTAIERSRVPVDEEDVVPQPPEEYE